MGHTPQIARSSQSSYLQNGSHFKNAHRKSQKNPEEQPLLKNGNKIEQEFICLDRRSKTTCEIKPLISNVPLQDPKPVKFDCIEMPSPDVSELLECLSSCESLKSVEGKTASEIYLIESFEDLSKDNLRQRIHLNPSTRATEKSCGKLFSNERPVTLVINLQEMSPNDIVAMNDLLDPDKPMLNKRQLGSHVELLVLFGGEQLSANSNNSLGPDTCRRLNRIANTWSYSQKIDHLRREQNNSGSPLKSIGNPDDKGDTKREVITINLFDGSIPCRSLLIGTYGIKTGQGLGWNEGALLKLKAHQHVIFTDPPQNDPEFQQILRNIRNTNEVVANGVQVKLPEGITFAESFSEHSERTKLFENIKFSKSVPRSGFIAINSANINNWLSSFAIDRNGVMGQSEALKSGVESNNSIVVTSELNEQQWINLLNTLNIMSAQTGLQLPEIILRESNQPESLFANIVVNDVCSGLSAVSAHIDIKRTMDEEASILAICNQEPDAEIVRISPETTLSQLFENVHIASEATFQYGFRPSGLMKALKAGKAIILCGLEKNPGLQLELESLFSRPAYVLINGRMVSGSELSIKKNIHVIWPDKARSVSPLWNDAIDQSERYERPESIITAESQLLHDGLQKLQQFFETLPGSYSSIKLPELSPSLVRSVLVEAKEIARQEGVLNLYPEHYRKAISRIYTHVTREHRKARHFMEVFTRQIWPDAEDSKPWVDVGRMAALLGDGHLVNKQFLKTRYWEFAGMFSEHYFLKHLPNGFSSADTDQLKWLEALVVYYAPESIKKQLVRRFKPDESLTKDLPQAVMVSSIIQKVLHNALYSGWHLRNTQKEPTQRKLAVVSSLILAQQLENRPEHKKAENVKAILKKHVVRDKRCQRSWSFLVNQILSSQINQEGRELRKLGRLQERIQRNKLITLEGPSGTSKSYLANKAARGLGQTFTVTVGPGAEEGQLVKQWQWQKNGKDRSMIEQEGIILQWAKTKPEPGRYVTLVVDEANLAAHLLDNVLAGIWFDPPHIFSCSEKLDITPQHRVVFTCNPGGYSGRSRKTLLQDRGSRAHFSPLSPGYLKDRVVMPALNKAFKSRSIKGLSEKNRHALADVIIDLQQQFKQFLPDRVFTPRDLTDACAWIEWQLKYIRKKVTLPELNNIAWTAFDNIIGSSLTEKNKDAYQVLQLWFKHRYQITDLKSDATNGADQRLKALYADFCRYCKTANRDFDSASPSVQSLVMKLAQDLDRLDVERKKGVQHTGRRATVVEGPAGRGKDATLKLLLDLWIKKKSRNESDVLYYNAVDCEWADLKDAIREAHKKGKILVVSELNLISSADLEGQLNDVLTEPCTPGFHLFATTNPPEYAGRNAFSPALKDRVRYIRIENYSQRELTKIAQQKLPAENDKGMARRIAALHCYIDQRLKNSGHMLSPVCSDIQSLAAVVKTNSDLVRLFASHYYLYLKKGNISRDELTHFLSTLTEQGPKTSEDQRCKYDLELCNWLFSTVPGLKKPLLIQRSHCDGCEVASTKEVFVAQEKTFEQAQVEVFRQAIRWVWSQETGLPVHKDEYNDLMTASMFIALQRQWFEKRFVNSTIPASEVFKLSDYLKVPALPVSKAHLEKIKSLTESHHGILPTEIWERILNSDYAFDSLPAKSKSHCLTYVKAACIPIGVAARKPKGTALTRDTNYDICNKHKPGISMQYEQTFYEETNIESYRNEFIECNVTANGDIYHNRRTPDEEHLITVFPKKMAEPELSGAQQLCMNEVYGSHHINVSSSNERYPLPGFYLNEKIEQVRTVPETEYKVFFDVYSGQHWVQFPELDSEYSIRVHYILKSKNRGGDAEIASVNETHKPKKVRYIERLPSLGSKVVHQKSKEVLVHCPDNIRWRVEEAKKAVEALSQKSALSEKDQLLLNIFKVESNAERISATAAYCRAFTGDRRPTDKDNLAYFIIRYGVGSCKYRSTVFKFILQSFGIPCRVINSQVHVWPEVWDGQTWQIFELDGAPNYKQILVSDFPEIKKYCRSGRDEASDTLAAMCDPVTEFFEQGTVDSVIQGCQLLSTCKKYGFREYLVERDKVTSALLNGLNSLASSGSEQVQKILPEIEALHNGLDAICEKHSERQWDFFRYLLSDHLMYMEKQGTSNQVWVSGIVDYMMNEGWLSPKAQRLYGFFQNLKNWRYLGKAVPTLKALSDQNIKDWYSCWRANHFPFAPDDYYHIDTLKKVALNDTDHHVTLGRSVIFEKLLGAVAKVEQWSTQPNSKVSVARLLQGDPAFAKDGASLSHKGKPVFIINDGSLDTRDQTEEFKNGFIHYLYSVTSHLGSSVNIGLASNVFYALKAFEVISPSSAGDLKYYLLNLHKPRATYSKSLCMTEQLANVAMLEKSRIQEMMNDEDLVVIKTEQLQAVYDEYCKSLGV